jgi:hypothetical protein
MVLTVYIRHIEFQIYIYVYIYISWLDGYSSVFSNVYVYVGMGGVVSVWK